MEFNFSLSVGAFIDLVNTSSAASNPPIPPGCWFAIALDIKGTKIPKRRAQKEDKGEMEALELKLKSWLVI